MDGRWRVGGEQAGELGARLDYERATGRSHGAVNEYADPYTREQDVVRVGKGSGVGRENKKGEEGDAAFALALCDYIH